MEIKRKDNEELWQAVYEQGDLVEDGSSWDDYIVLIVQEPNISLESVLSPYLGMKMVLSGTYDYKNGLDDTIRVYRKVLVEVPEQVIPAYTQEVWKELKDK